MSERVQRSRVESSKAGDVQRRDFVIGGACAMTAALAALAKPKIQLRAKGINELAKLIPLRVGAWNATDGVGQIMPPTDEQRANAMYDQVAIRNFESDVAPTVLLLIAYSALQSGALQVHRPESCYPAAGFAIVDRPEVALPNGRQGSFNAQAMTAISESRTEEILYWTRIGALFPATWHQQCAAVRRQNLQGFVPDGILVRMSIVGSDTERAAGYLPKFAVRLLSSVGLDMRHLLIGPVSAVAN